MADEKEKQIFAVQEILHPSNSFVVKGYDTFTNIMCAGELLTCYVKANNRLGIYRDARQCTSELRLDVNIEVVHNDEQESGSFFESQDVVLRKLSLKERASKQALVHFGMLLGHVFENWKEVHVELTMTRIDGEEPYQADVNACMEDPEYFLFKGLEGSYVQANRKYIEDRSPFLKTILHLEQSATKPGTTPDNLIVIDTKFPIEKVIAFLFAIYPNRKPINNAPDAQAIRQFAQKWRFSEMYDIANAYFRNFELRTERLLNEVEAKVKNEHTKILNRNPKLLVQLMDYELEARKIDELSKMKYIVKMLEEKVKPT